MKRTKRGAKHIFVTMLSVILVMESVSMPVQGEVKNSADAQTKIVGEQISDNSVEKYAEETVSANFVSEEELVISANTVVKSGDVVPLETATIEYKGTDGNLEWSIDSEGCLVVTGEGDFKATPDWLKYRSYIETAYVNVQKITSMNNFFNNCSNLKEIDFAETDTSNVTDMSGMFSGCSKLSGLHVSSFDTSKVITMEKMFYGCGKLSRVQISEYNTSNVTTMKSMFQGCANMDKVDVSGLDTENVTDMSNMFSGCKTLKAIDISGFDTGKVTTMRSMFSNCEALEDIKIGEIDTSKVEYMDYMFSRCINVQELNLSNLKTDCVINMGYMFSGCEKIEELDISNFNYENVVTMSHMFDNCSMLKLIELGDTKTKKLQYMEYMFNNCSEIEALDLSCMDTANVSNMSYLFYGCESLKELDVRHFKTSNVTTMRNMFAKCSRIESLNLKTFDTQNVVDMYGMFLRCEALTELDVTTFNTKKVEDMGEMFEGCSGLKQLDVRNFDTSLVQSMCWMFSGCSSLEKLDVSTFNTSNVMYMSHMFNGCSKLTVLKLGNIDTSAVTDMSYMFADCKSLKNLDEVNDLECMSTKDMSYMFKNCSELTKLDVAGLNTVAVEKMTGMFYGCSGLTDLSAPMYTVKVTDMSFMFYECSSLTFLSLSNFNVYNVKTMNYMFGDCSKLSNLTFYCYNSSKLESIAGMYSGCKSLERVYLAGMNTINVTDMRYMFNECSCLTDLDVSNFVTSKVYGMSGMFRGCSKLKEIDITKFDAKNLLYYESLFEGCTNLIFVKMNATVLEKLCVNTKSSFGGCELFSDIYFVGTTGEWAIIKPTWQNSSETKLKYAAIHLNDGTIEQNLYHAGDFLCLKEGGGEFDDITSYPYKFDMSVFFEKTDVYHHDLSQMSVRVAMASMSTEDNVNSNHIRELMNDLNVSNKVTHYPHPEYDSIGYVMGTRRIYHNNEKKTLVMVSIRSGGYGKEWGGNANVGLDSEHVGFELASDQVYWALNDYIGSLKECGFTDGSDIVVWISGFSRGAATANLVAAKMDNYFLATGYVPDTDIYAIKADSVFAYCFECPQNTTNMYSRTSRFNNIFNIINPKDLVTSVAMNNGRDWRFQRYGRDLILPDETNTNWEDYAKYKLEMELKYPSGEAPEFEVGQAILVKDAAKRLGNLMERELYPVLYQEKMQMILTGAFLEDYNLGEALCDYASLNLIALDTFNTELIKIGVDIGVINSGIIRAHYPELCMAWLDSIPEEVLLRDKSLIRVTISSPGDVYVYQDEIVVGTIENGQVKSIENGITTLLDDNNQMIIVLPGDSEYSLEYTATENGQLMITTSKYVQAEAVPENVSCYYNIPIEAGEMYEANVANADFELLDDAGNIVKSTAVQSGDEVVMYKIGIEIKGNGTATGINTYTLGENAKVVACPNEKEEFLGWYENDVLISQDKEYCFCVKSDTMLVAQFTQNVKQDENKTQEEDVDDNQKTDEKKEENGVKQYVIDKNTYKITNSAKKTVSFIKTNSKSKTVKIPATIIINGETYKVTAIASNALKGNKKVTKVVIGKNVTSIGKKAFYKCVALKTITIPAKVRTIGESAFYGCKKLTKVTLGKGVIKIGKKAFYNCRKLKTITIKTRKLKTVGKYAFKGIAKRAIVKSPAGKVKKYKQIIKKSKIGKKVKFK